MKKIPLKTVILYSRGHMGSILVLNKLLKMKCYDVTAVVRVKNVDLTNDGFKKFKKDVKKTGLIFALMLFYQFLIQGLAFLISFIFPFLKKRTKTSSELSRKHGFKMHDAININSPETLEFLREQNADIFISAYFPQILKKDALSIPEKGVLNVHPGYIPEYKGAMAYFWALKNNAKSAGVSIHWMDEGIDSGPLLARKKFRIRKNSSQDKLLILTAVIGSSLLNRIGKKLVKGTEIKAIDTSKEAKAYYSLPGKQAFKEYYLAHSFISFGAIFKAILGKY